MPCPGQGVHVWRRRWQRKRADLPVPDQRMPGFQAEKATVLCGVWGHWLEIPLVQRAEDGVARANSQKGRSIDPAQEV